MRPPRWWKTLGTGGDCDLCTCTVENQLIYYEPATKRVLCSDCGFEEGVVEEAVESRRAGEARLAAEARG